MWMIERLKGMDKWMNISVIEESNYYTNTNKQSKKLTKK